MQPPAREAPADPDLVAAGELDAVASLAEANLLSGLGMQAMRSSRPALGAGHLMPPEIVGKSDYQIPSWPSTPEGEERQADELVRHYTTLFLHPAVAAATYRGPHRRRRLARRPRWPRPRRRHPKPAYDALRSLVRGDWWLPSTAVRTDETGSFVLDAYAGEYPISARGGQAPLTLAAGTPEVVVPLPSAGDPLTWPKATAAIGLVEGIAFG